MTYETEASAAAAAIIRAAEEEPTTSVPAPHVVLDRLAIAEIVAQHMRFSGKFKLSDKLAISVPPSLIVMVSKVTD